MEAVRSTNVFILGQAKAIGDKPSPPRPNPTRALAAAIARVYPHLRGVDFERELAWTHAEMRWGKSNRICWSAMPVGQLLRTRMAEAQNWRCCYCAVEMSPECRERHRAPTIEHIVRLIDGGDDHPDNMAVACQACNEEENRRHSVLADIAAAKIELASSRTNASPYSLRSLRRGFG